jgi:hypothetical protein
VRLGARPSLAALTTTLAFSACPGAQAVPEATVTAAGGLAWISDDALEAEGLMQVDLRVPLRGGTFVAGGFATRTSILGADGVTFAVRDVRYDGDLFLGHELRSGLLLFGGGGVWGKEAVDAQGSAQAGLLGLGLGVGSGALTGRVELGAVVDAREIDADAWGRLRARWRRPLGGWAAGIDVDLRVLEGSNTDSDLSVGPAFEVPAGDLLVRVFAAYLRHRTPLGLGLEGAQVGVTFEDLVPGPMHGGRTAPGGDVSGRIGVGAGDAQRMGRLQIVAASPRWRARWRVAADVDGQAIAGADPGDLFYRYTVGVERFLHTDRTLVGVWFYHRSGHRLGEPGEPVTSWNVVEAGMESEGFRHGTARAPRAAWGRLDGRVRAGFLLDSSFGEDRGWHARAGGRWTAPWPWEVVPFVEAAAEEGDVQVREAAAGIGFPSGLELAIGWLDDPQRFAPDPSALLGTATLRF